MGKITRNDLENIIQNDEKLAAMVAFKVLGKARKYCQKRTGSHTGKSTGHLARRLQSDIKKVGDKWLITIGTSVPYAPYVEFGTPAHEIEPTKSHGLLGPIDIMVAKKGRKAPGFFTTHKPIFVKGSVWHPGTHPTFFLRDALHDSEKDIQNLIVRYLGGNL